MDKLREFRIKKNKSIPMTVAALERNNSSISDVSTFSADDCSPRIVRFAKRKKFRGVVSFKCMDTKQRESLWYTRGELRLKRWEEVRAISSDTLRVPADSHIEEINKMFHRSCSLSTTLNMAETDKLLRDQDALKEHTVGFQRFLETEESDRGLEEWISSPERALRLKTASETRNSLIKASKLFSEKGYGPQDEILAEAYRKKCHAAKIYARLIAAADAQAVCSGQGEETREPSKYMQCIIAGPPIPHREIFLPVITA
jgi:hypothetical protein